RGIVELAAHRNVLATDIDLAKARPPYKSEWPLEAVPEALIETYKQNYGKGEFHDEIVSSTINDGDFARYIIDHSVDDWSSFPIALSGLSKKDLFDRWSKKCFDAHADALAIVSDLVEVAIELRKIYDRTPTLQLRVVFVSPGGEENEKKNERSPELRTAEKRQKASEDQLRHLIGEELWAEYEQHARPYLLDGI